MSQSEKENERVLEYMQRVLDADIRPSSELNLSDLKREPISD